MSWYRTFLTGVGPGASPEVQNTWYAGTKLNQSIAGTINRLVGRTIETTFLGEASEHVLSVNGQRIKVICTPPQFNPPQEMTVTVEPRDVVVLPN